ncbi:hypothetical protein EGW08_013172 [Elysia chlorotica]|uniref:C-type lectin domain-containing protein n=1 Tax=Elysia chlorotica TaxID=188477 RepID=A0A3S1HGT1_ELYCH|nr:hypothetical protein EGW08_013172 [Elysia chlorotica]
MVTSKSAQVNGFRVLVIFLLTEVFDFSYSPPWCDITQLRHGNCSKYPYVWIPAFKKCLANTESHHSFDETEAICRDWGGHLVKIENDKQNDRLNYPYECGPQKVQCTVKYPWIGLRRTEYNSFTWVSDGTNWTHGVDWGRLSLNESADCVYWDHFDQMWELQECDDSTNGVCEEDYESKPEKPEIISETVTSAVGITIKVTCRSLLGVHGAMMFYILGAGDGPNTELHIFESATLVVNYTEEHKLDWNGKCNRFVETKLSLPFSEKLVGKTLACVSYISDNNSICATGDKFCTKLKEFEISSKRSSFSLQSFILDHVIIIAPFVVSVVACIFIILWKARAKPKPPVKQNPSASIVNHIKKGSRPKLETLFNHEIEDNSKSGGRKLSKGSPGSKASKESKGSKVSKGPQSPVVSKRSDKYQGNHENPSELRSMAYNSAV